MPKIETLPGHAFGLIADAHIHPGKTPPFPDKLAKIFASVDRILALGDMGEASGLDALSEIAPVTAIAGEDDAHGDVRLQPLRLFECGGVSIAALFDGAKNGLFKSNDPLQPSAAFETALLNKFECKPQILLCAGTHKAFTANIAGVFIVNPGSPTLADHPNVTILRIDGTSICAEQIPL